MARLLLLILVFSLPATAQLPQDVRLEAKLNKRKLLVNSTVEYTLTLYNQTGTNLQAPKFRNATVLTGPSRTMRTSLINGLRSSSISYTWLLKPREPGRLTVGPASIRAGDRTLRSNSQSAEVLPVDADAQAAAPDVFARADVSTVQAYPGQKITLDLHVYSSVRTDKHAIMNEPSFADFFTEAQRNYSGVPVTVIENGREYTRRNLGSLALFPTKTGRLTITPYDLLVNVVHFPTSGNFRRRRNAKIAVSTDTVYIDVRELPQPVPPNFSGGVGKFTFAVEVDRNRMSVDDALEMRLTVSGEGDIKRIKAFDPVDPTIFNVYDPKILREDLYDTAEGTFGRKVMEYQLIPKKNGEYQLRPTLVYFDVDSADYVSITPEVIPMTITGEAGPAFFEPDSIEGVQLRLLPVEGEVPEGKIYGRSATGSLSFWLLFLAPPVLAGSLIGLRTYREKRAGRDPAEVARGRAAKVATARLRAAAAHRQAGEARQFYDAVEGATLGYLRDKYGLSVADASRARIRQKLADAGADASLVSRYDSLLQRCEMALYAGQDGAEDLNETYQTARALIIDTEKLG